MTPFEANLRQAAADLEDLGVRWAMIGGVAVSARSAPRFTKDVDVVIAVASDTAAEGVIHQLSSRGYLPRAIIEHEYVDRLSTVRLTRGASDFTVDLLFASSGIEAEIVAAATTIEIAPDLQAPIALTGHLIALKVLAGRRHDQVDLDALLGVATDDDLATAREAVALIVERGFHRDQDVVADLEQVIAAAREA